MMALVVNGRSPTLNPSTPDCLCTGRGLYPNLRSFCPDDGHGLPGGPAWSLQDPGVGAAAASAADTLCGVECPGTKIVYMVLGPNY